MARTTYFNVRVLAVVAALVLAACLLALVVRVEPSQAAFPGQNGKIAFQSDRDTNGNWEIYTMNPDGSNQTNISNNAAIDWYPAWSPDGTKIAFESHPAREQIYVMNADGSNQTNISNSPAFDGRPAWSPDGSKIAFVRQTVGTLSEIYVMNADGSNQTNISNNPSIDADPAWSPDGKKIAFSSARDGNLEIYTMNADGSNQTRLTTSTLATDDRFPDWQPITASVPTTKVQCKKGGWKDFGYPNQGTCISDVNRRTR